MHVQFVRAGTVFRTGMFGGQVRQIAKCHIHPNAKEYYHIFDNINSHELNLILKYVTIPKVNFIGNLDVRFPDMQNSGNLSIR